MEEMATKGRIGDMADLLTAVHETKDPALKQAVRISCKGMPNPGILRSRNRELDQLPIVINPV